MLLHPPAKAPALEAGQRLPELALSDIRGQRTTLRWNGDTRPTIVYVFTPTCVWCKRNMTAMKTVFERSSGYRFIGISLTDTGLADYVKKSGLAFPVYYADSGQATVAALKITATPETLVVSRDGTVRNVWVGAYSGKVATQIEQQFGVALPKLELGGAPDDKHS